VSSTDARLKEQLLALKLHQILEQYPAVTTQAAKAGLSHVEYLARLIEAEALARDQRALDRRLAAARFPVLKTLEGFQWHWPKKINRQQVQNLFRLAFVPARSNVIFLGGVGLGKTHLATALGHAAVVAGHTVRFAGAVDIINTLTAAQADRRLKIELQKLVHPAVLVIDELGYLPIDKTGADLLFQVISQRYERGSTILTTNQPFKAWPKVFNSDATLASAVLDRLLHHAETIVIEGKSYRMKDQIEASDAAAAS
jgi:DNA replication protein DnaC